MRHLICAGFAAIILSGCINDPEEQTYTLSLPLNVGNQWEYESITYFINSQLKNDTLRDSSHIFLSITDVILRIIWKLTIYKVTQDKRSWV
jgi:hypothetical protein